MVVETIVNDYISRELINKQEMLPLRNDTPLIESGILDSLALLRLLVFLEESFNVQVDDFDFIPDNFNTVDAICAYIRAQQGLQVT
jgi:acyl carrier protein